LKAKKGKLAIIDADGFLFFAGWHFRDMCNPIGLKGAKTRVDKMIERILDKIGADYYIGFYGNHGSKNFRYDWATLKSYKGGRTSPPWQEYFKPTIKKHFADKWGFYGTSQLEADDAVTIAFHKYKKDYNVVMVGEDKDMLQMAPFTRFNTGSGKRKLEDFEWEEGRKFFWSQMLHGDGSDNIPGIEGIGAGKKGGKTSNNPIVVGLWDLEEPSEEDMFIYVRNAYINKYGADYLYYMVENYMLLNMMTKPVMDYPKDVELIKWGKKNNLAKKKLIKL